MSPAVVHVASSLRRTLVRPAHWAALFEVSTSRNGVCTAGKGVFILLTVFPSSRICTFQQHVKARSN